MGELFFTTGHYDSPTPLEARYDGASPSGAYDSPTPDEGGYDDASPNGHYDAPTPKVTLV
jgi:hypothetical protein